MTAASISTPSRRRAAAALAAVAVGAVALLIPLQSGASAAPARPAAAPGGAVVAGAVAAAPASVTTTAGKVELTVDPAGGLTTAGATLMVTGAGFDPSTGIYVAICHADGKAPASLADCVGGAIPKSNPSRSWAHISNDTGSAASAPVAAKWGAGGTFSVELPLPASDSASEALDCAKVPCAVYTAPDIGRGTAENVSIPLVYAAPVTRSPSSAVTSSSTTSSAAASSTVASSSVASSTAALSPASSAPQFSTSSAVVPKTVQAKSVRSPDVVAGAAQELLFAGFTGNEPVTVTLYSAPQPLPATRADKDGVVKVDFTVPTNLEPGTHLLRVVGQTSKVTGIASFVVTAPVVSSSAIVVPSTPATTSAATSAPVSSAVAPPMSSASSAASTAPVSSAAVAVAPPASSGRAVWPWYALGVLLAILAGVVAYLLNRRFRLAVERRDNDAMLADAAAAEHERNLDAIARANADAPTAYLGGAGPVALPAPPPEGYAGYHPGEHGLLAGRDHPDNPGLLSGTGRLPMPPLDQPTTFLPGEPTTALPGQPTTALPGQPTTALPGEPTALPGQPTTALPVRPTAARPDDATGTWRPDFDPEGDEPGEPGRGRHSRPS